MGFQNRNKIEFKGINLKKNCWFLVHTGTDLISKSSLNLLKSLLYYIFDFLNHWMFRLSLTKTNWSSVLWLCECLYICPSVLKQIVGSFHTMVLMIENSLEDKLWDSARQFQVTYLKYLHVYLHKTSLTESHYHPSPIKHQSEFFGKTGTHSQNFIKRFNGVTLCF